MLAPFSDPVTFELVADPASFLAPFSDPVTIDTSPSEVWFVATGSGWEPAEIFADV